MRKRLFGSLILSWLIPAGGSVLADEGNSRINYQEFADQTRVVGELRNSRRVSEREFLEMSKDPATIVLDARSKEKFDLLHIRGAKNLSFPDITADELAKVIPTKNTRVLIYCNNNFRNEPVAFPLKFVSTSLNIHTFNVLHNYGYANIYELKPLLDINETILPFEGQRAHNDKVAIPGP